MPWPRRRCRRRRRRARWCWAFHVLLGSIHREGDGDARTKFVDLFCARRKCAEIREILRSRTCAERETKKLLGALTITSWLHAASMATKSALSAVASYPDLAGKVAVVTGGSKGIGAATSRLLGRNGVRVAVGGRDQASIDGVVAQIEEAGGEA